MPGMSSACVPRTIDPLLEGQFRRTSRLGRASTISAVSSGKRSSADSADAGSPAPPSSLASSASATGGRGGGGPHAASSGAVASPLGTEAATPAPTLALSRRRAMSATLDKVREAMPSSNHNKKDLVQWLLPSDKHRKDGLIEAAHVAAEAAEEARRACHANWQALRVAIHGAVQVSWGCVAPT